MAALLIILLPAGCTKPPVFGQLPYSVLVNSYENTEEAEQAAKRLTALKFNAFTIKRVNTAGDFTIDLCVGVFKTAQQAKKMEAKLKGKGLNQAEVILYDKVMDDIEEFRKLPEKERTAFVLPSPAAPDLPEPILEILSLLPGDPAFRIARLKVEDGGRNLGESTGRDALVFDGELLPPGLMLDKLREQAGSLVQAVFEDSLYRYQVAVLAALLETPGLAEDLLKNSALGNVRQENLNYPSGGGFFSGKLYARDPGHQYSYLAFNADTNYLLAFETADCPLEVLRTFIKKGAIQSGFAGFPGIQRNLAILPRWDDTDLPVFSGLSFGKVTADFAAERGNSAWAESIAGNDHCRAYYVTGKDTFVVSVFNLNYRKTAENVFQVFVADNAALQTGAVQQVLDGDGWYSDTPGFAELSFIYGSYFIALDYLGYLDWEHEFYHEIYKRFNAEKEMRLELLLQYAGKLQLPGSQDIIVNTPVNGEEE